MTPLKMIDLTELKKLLRTGTKRQKLSCIKALEELGSKRHASLLLELFESSKRDLVLLIEAAKALQCLESKRTIAPLLRFAHQGVTIEQRQAAIIALTWCNDSDVGVSLSEIVADHRAPSSIRGEAAEVTGQNLVFARKQTRDFKLAGERLIAVLNDRSPEVRFWAAFALGLMGCRMALPALRKLKRSDKALLKGWWYVAEEADDAIAMIEGRDPKARVAIHVREKHGKTKKKVK